MANHTVRFKGMQQNNGGPTSSVSLQIFNWTTGVDPGDTVYLANHPASNMPIYQIQTSQVIFQDADGNDQDTFGPIAENGQVGPLTVKNDAAGDTVKYKITYNFEEGDAGSGNSYSGSFVVDPRFIIGGGEVTR